MIPMLAAIAVLAQDSVSYARPEAWLCRPGRQDVCAVDLTTTVVASNGGLTTENWAADQQAPIDCFYVYPTVSRDSTEYSDMIPGDDERGVVRQQFARFASVCRPYAPLYRQVTRRGLRALMTSNGGAGPALSRGRGYDDVAAAWAYYLSHDNEGRGVVLIGHSQGSMILEELIRREIEGKPIQSRIVSALLTGSNVAVPRGRDVGGAFQSMRLCQSASQTGCVVAYSSFRNTVPPSSNALFGRVSGQGMAAACTNPARLAGASDVVHAYFSATGTPFGGGSAAQPHRWVTTGTPITTPFVSVPGLLTAQCVSDSLGTRLEVTVRADTADPRADDIPGDIAPGTPVQAQWGLHLVDMNLTMGNLVDIVRRQSAAFRSSRR
jgi:Protein of unknown function (DUF3089)